PRAGPVGCAPLRRRRRRRWPLPHRSGAVRRRLQPPAADARDRAGPAGAQLPDERGDRRLAPAALLRRPVPRPRAPAPTAPGASDAGAAPAAAVVPGPAALVAALGDGARPRPPGGGADLPRPPARALQRLRGAGGGRPRPPAAPAPPAPRRTRRGR